MWYQVPLINANRERLLCIFEHLRPQPTNQPTIRNLSNLPAETFGTDGTPLRPFTFQVGEAMPILLACGPSYVTVVQECGIQILILGSL